MDIESPGNHVESPGNHDLLLSVLHLYVLVKALIVTAETQLCYICLQLMSLLSFRMTSSGC